MNSFENRGIASGPHLALMLVLLACFPVLLKVSGASSLASMPSTSPAHTGTVIRFCTVATSFLWFACLVAALGIRSSERITVRELIGVDASVRAGVLKTLLTTIIVLMALVATGVVSHAILNQFGQGSSSMQGMVSQNPSEATAFLVMALSAGFAEEFVFRGYLQRQLYAATGSIVLASFLQISIFTLGHAYQGFGRLFPVFLVGCVLTAVAQLRKTLLPGMIAHGLGDSLVAILYLLQALTR